MPPTLTNVALDVLTYFKSAGFALAADSDLVVDSKLDRPASKDLSSFETELRDRRSLARGDTAALRSRVGLGRSRMPALLKWLQAAPGGTVPRVLHVGNNKAILEVGSSIVVLEPAQNAGVPLSRADYHTTVTDTPSAVAANETWLRAYPKTRERKVVPQVSVLIQNRDGGLGLKDVDLKPLKIKDAELDLFYGSNMAAFHNDLVERLGMGHSGLTILHGPPGGGKTSYVRYLTRCLRKKKKVVLMPRGVLEVLGTPAFVNLLIGLQATPSILLIEDAEEVIATGSRVQGSATSTLLNLTDGILNDIASTQVIVTFNCPVAKVDEALLRNGRLIARREFGPLSATEARALAAARGLDGSSFTRGAMLCDVLCAPALGSTTKPKTVGFAS